MSEYSRLLAEQEREEQNTRSLSVIDTPAQDPAEGKTTLTPYSDMLDQQETTPARVGVGLRAGRDGSPDTAAEILGLSKKTGMAPEMVERNLDEVRSLNADQELNAEIDTLAERSPSTAAFLALDRLKAAQASDDVGVLASIEQAVVDTAKAIASEDTANAIIRKGIFEPFMGGPYGSLVRSPIELQDLQEKERQELNRRANMFGASLDDKVAAGFANVRSYIPDPLASLARGATYVTQQIDEAVFGAPERTTSEAVQAASKQFQERLKAYAPKAKPGSYNYYVSEIIGSAFGMAPTIALGAVAGPSAGMSELGMRVYGLSYNEGRERGMDPRAASIRASYMAAVEAVTEKIPLEKILEPIVKGGKRGLTQRAKNILASMGLEGAQEGLVSILEIAYDTSLQGMEGIENFDAKKELQKVIDSVIIGGGAGGLTSTATNIVGSVMDKRRASVTQAQTAEQLDRVRESMLRQRSPEAFDEFFQMLSDNNDQGDILVSATPVMDYLAQAGENPRDFFQQLGVDEETITKAYEAGGDIEIKAGKFFSLMPDNEFRDQILLNLREAAGVPTVAEAEIRSTQMQERMEKMMEEMTSEERTEVNTTTERVRQRFVQDAIAAGRPRADAQNAGAVWDAVFRTSLDAYANDPNRTRPLSEIARELEEQVFNVRARSVAFEDRGQPLEQTVDTTSENFRQFFEGSQVVDERGEPLVVYHGTSGQIFDVFDMSRGEIARALGGDGAHFFTANKEHAAFFAGQDDRNVMSVYLSMRNPMVISQADLEAAQVDFARDEMENRPEDFEGETLDDVVDFLDESPIDFVADFVSGAKAAGYDGLIIRDFADLDQSSDVFLPFSSNQIKSVDNRGTYDSSDANILNQPIDTTSENFRNWFRASKIVDANGEPQIVYHGTDTGFLEFDPDMLGAVTGASDSLEGFWFSTDRYRAKDAAADAMALSDTNMPYIMELYLSVQNPFYGGSLKGMDTEDSAKIIREAKAAGHDGVIFDGEMEGQDIIVFEPTQIKSPQNYRPSGTYDAGDPRILFQDGPRFQETHSNDDRVELEKNKHGLMPYLRDYSDAEPTREGKPIVIKSNNKNAASELDKIDEVLAANPDAHTSAVAWKKMMADAYGTQDVPIAPYRFLEEINSDTIVRNLSRLTPGQIEDADHGFENARKFREAYTSGSLDVETTGKMFMWSFLSRGVSPYAQESLFIDAFPEAGVWMAAAAEPGFDVNETALNIDLGSGAALEAREQLVIRANLESWADTNKKRKKAGKRALPKPNDFAFRLNEDGTVNTTYTEWAKSVAPKGSGRPGAGATHNLNAFGKDFLTKMSTDVGDGTGRTKLQYIHDLMSDPNSTGKMIRREFAKIGEGVGIDNKVVSFTLLVAGFDDVMVLDRVQFRQLYNDGRFDGINIYDGYKEPGKTGSVTGSGLAKQGDGTRGILIYEAFERAIETRISEVYAKLGRDGVGSVGRYHWETWVADSGQEASHGSIGAILPDALGEKEAINDVTAKQGEYGSYAYGARYGVDSDGISFFQYGTPSGKMYTFTVPQFVEFMDQVKLPKNGVVPSGYKVTETENAPWYEGEEINGKALDKLAEKLSAGRAGTRAGTVRRARKDTSISDRYSAGDAELYQTVDPPPSGIGRLYSQAQRATQSLTQQKATASQWLSHFKKNGVKDDEINWVVGLQEFLNSQKTIDKDDLSAFIEQNGIKLDEVELGGPDPERPASLVARTADLIEAGEELNRLHDILYSALEQLEGFSPNMVQNTIDFAAERGPTIVSDLEKRSPGIFETAKAFFEAAGEHRLAMEKADEEVNRYEGTRNLPARFASQGYVTRGPLEADHQEFYLTLPADLTEGNADIQDWLVPAGHEIGEDEADNRLVIRIRSSGRILEDGTRVLHIDEMQDDRGQAAEDEGVAEHIPNLLFRRDAFNLLWYDARQAIESGLGGPRWSRFSFTERESHLRYLLLTAVTHPQVFPDQKWTENAAFKDANYTPEQIEIVDKYIAALESEPDYVKTAYDPPGIPNRPFLGSNKVIPLALKRMMIEATERGYDAISWTSGDTQNERWGLDRAVDKVEVLDVTDDEAMIVVNQTSFGPIALEGVQVQDETPAPEYEIRQDENGELEIVDDNNRLFGYGFTTREDAEEYLDHIREQDELIGSRTINMVPIDMLPQIFGKGFADKIVEGGRNQIYTDLDLRVGGEGMKKFYDNIVRNAANDIGKKFKPNPRTGVGKIVLAKPELEPVGEYTVEPEFFIDQVDPIVDGMGMADIWDYASSIGWGGADYSASIEESEALTDEAIEFIREQEVVQGRQRFQVMQRFEHGEDIEISEAFETREEAEQELAEGVAERRRDPETPPDKYFVKYPDGRVLETFTDEASAENYAQMYTEAQTGERPAVTEDVWVFPLTPEIKNTILGEGLPMMQDPDDDPFGSYDPVRKVINLFEQANYSTLLHESGHAFVHIMEELSKRDDAPARITENYQAMLDWVGATNASDLDIRINGEAAREKQERLARAFEAYLREGKAPSAKLQSAFSQFREWLKKIYQNLTQLDVTMDDEIRTVFDRMLATDAEIDDVIAVNEFTMEDSPSILNMMSAEEREKAQGLQLRARDRAVEARALEQERYNAVMASDKYAEEMAGVVDELTPVVMRERKYASFYYLTNGEYYGDRETPDELKDKRISRRALLDAGFTKEQLQALPRANGKGGRALYSAKETEAMDPEILAVFLGYDSGRELIDDMMGVNYPNDEIARRAEEIMASRPDYTDPVNDGTLKQITEDALYNAEQAELIEMELDTLARAAGTQRESRVFLQAVADRLFKDEPIGTMLSQVKFAAASRRAARASEQAAAKENWQKAFEEKRKEILNFELHRRAVKAKYEVAKIQAKLNNYKRRKQDPRKVDPDYIAQNKALLEFYEFGRPSATGQIKPETARGVIEFIEGRQARGAQVILPGDLIEVAGLDPDSGDPRYVLRTKFWKDMTMPELRALRDLADNLMKQGRDSSQSAKEARRQRGEELAEGILDRTRYRRKKPEATRTYSRVELIKMVQRAATFAEHRKLESMIRQLDGFEALGPMYDAVFSRLAEAADNKAHLVTMILKMQNETGLLLTEEQRKTFNTSKSDVPIQALGGAPMRLEDRLAIALNWGSESSREAVLDDRAKKNQYGTNWNEDAINEILSTLDDNALNYVEATWQFIDTFWDDVTLPNGRTVNGIKTLEQESTGVAPPKVEASPFFVNGRQMSGGYYPLVYDNLSDVRVSKETEAEIMERLQSGGFARAHTTHGFTISRVGSGGRPIRTDLGVINKHLDEVTQDLSYRIAIQEAAAVLGNADVQAAIEQTMGRPFFENMQEILVRTATGQLNSNEMGAFNKHIANARINMTTAIMGLNLRSIGTQPFGLLQSINEIGVKDVGVGLAWFYKRQTRLNDRIAEIHTMSPYMAERATTMTRELDDIANSLQRRKKMDRMREWGFKPMVYVDVVSVAYPTWYGAYNKAMTGRVEGIDASNPQYTTSNQYTDLELKAIAYADMVVRMTQSAGGAQNMSMVQQRSETMKIMTMMYSYFNTTYNLQAEAFAKARADGSSIPKAVMKPSFIASTMLLQTLPALMASLVLDPWPDEDEAEEDPLFAWSKWSLKSLFSYVTGEFVFVRDFGSAVTHPFFGFSITPLESMAESAARLPGQIDKTIEAEFSEEAVSSLAKKITQVVGGIAGIPGSNQIAKTSDYLYKWSQGTLKNEPDTIAEGIYKSLIHGDR